jgi:hypothetical protein
VGVYRLQQIVLVMLAFEYQHHDSGLVNLLLLIFHCFSIKMVQYVYCEILVEEIILRVSNVSLSKDQLGFSRKVKFRSCFIAY